MLMVTLAPGRISQSKSKSEGVCSKLPLNKKPAVHLSADENVIAAGRAKSAHTLSPATRHL
jgi:hypothetical protein